MYEGGLFQIEVSDIVGKIEENIILREQANKLLGKYVPYPDGEFVTKTSVPIIGGTRFTLRIHPYHMRKEFNKKKPKITLKQLLNPSHESKKQEEKKEEIVLATPRFPF